MGALVGPALVVALAVPVRQLVGANSSTEEPQPLDFTAQRSYVYDRNGNLMTTLFFDENRAPVPLDQIPEEVRRAVIAVEDAHFFEHDGVDLRATMRALFANVESGGIEQGGSTITMQLVKNATRRAEQTLERKAREAVLAYRMEQDLSKEEILERYLNTVYFGNGAYGVQAAAETYWGKSAGELGWPEGALLASLIRDPNDYDPFSNFEVARERRRVALDRLVEVGDLAAAEADEFAGAALPVRQATPAVPVARDYFSTEVVQQLLNDPRYGIGDDAQTRNRSVFLGGLRIHTTLDPVLQQKALETRESTLPDEAGPGLFTIRGGRQDLATDCPKLNDGTDCLGTVAETSVEPTTGAVRMLIGGPGFETWKYDIVTQGPRQPGSSMKLFVLLAALENGYIINDSINGGDCAFPIPGQSTYKVRGSGGTASLTQVTAGSVNCAYLRLGQVVGVDKVIEMTRRLGVTSDLPEVVSFPLGVSPVTPLQMTAAYAAVANDGMYNAPYFIDKITDAAGKVLYQHEHRPTRVMTEQTARQATVALRAVVSGGTATRARLGDRQVAGKTGTTDEHGDAWFIGFTPQLATGVWMGSPETTVPLFNVGGVNVFGGTFPAMLWHNYMAAALEGAEPLEFPEPEAPPRRGKFLAVPRGLEVRTAPTPRTTTAPPAARPAPARPAGPTTTVPGSATPVPGTGAGAGGGGTAPTTAPTAPATSTPPTSAPPAPDEGGP
ncbi:MAG: transglycosylase domain-containing protein [Acidimicrobiia bacterium]